MTEVFMDFFPQGGCCAGDVVLELMLALLCRSAPDGLNKAEVFCHKIDRDERRSQFLYYLCAFAPLR
jgi:hypothetical protein